MAAQTTLEILVDGGGASSSTANVTLSVVPIGSGGQYFGNALVKAIAYNSNTISESVTVTAGNNGLSAGPITITSGYTVTVQSGARWVVV